MTYREHLEELHRRHGTLTAVIVLEEARSEDSPLHAFVFNKSIDEAAEEYFLGRARDLIRVCRISHITPEGERGSVRAFHAIRTPSGNSYEPAQRVAEDPFLSKLVLNDMQREWHAMKRRYESFEQFWLMVQGSLPASVEEKQVG